MPVLMGWISDMINVTAGIMVLVAASGIILMLSVYAGKMKSKL